MRGGAERNSGITKCGGECRNDDRLIYSGYFYGNYYGINVLNHLAFNLCRG